MFFDDRLRRPALLLFLRLPELHLPFQLLPVAFERLGHDAMFGGEDDGSNLTKIRRISHLVDCGGVPFHPRFRQCLHPCALHGEIDNLRDFDGIISSNAVDTIDKAFVNGSGNLKARFVTDV
jgi:hypothetical protein